MALASVVSPPLGLTIATAEHDLADRLRHEAQVQSNSGRYEEARQLRAIAEALKNKDAVMNPQARAELEKKHLDKAMELLKIR
ncbi:hypothetical protein [Candidatus Nitrospira bockiana]